MPDTINLLLVDDHVSMRDALAFLLGQQPDLNVVGCAGSIAEAMPLLAGIDVALLDLELPDGNGTALIPALRQASPAVAVLVLTGHANRVEYAQAIEAGADGALHKSAAIEEIITAIRRLAAGQQIMARAEITELLRLASRFREREQRMQKMIAMLTPREREILVILTEGVTEKEIAQRLGISEHTARNHMVSIVTKLGVHSRWQALLLAIRYGVVTLPPPHAELE